METKQTLDLKSFSFPNVTGVDIAFSTFDTIPELLEEAKARGFYNGHTKYNNLFSSLFFSGGEVKFKSGLDDDFKKRAWAYCRSLMSSFSPRHEDKEAVCAMLMSELLTINSEAKK